MTSDPLLLQVDLGELRFAEGGRDFTSVIAVLQTMLHDAGYAFSEPGPDLETHADPGTARG
ncbi:hypothetical protein PHMEG_00010380 [Phytophthora megakarya]|uniref:Uncharacterized protein n=1 Tax=Phytophthora megakarya TaxID=4795 RepID=A0A225WEU9_9STRA|nr:hypothetical protein PHMEG_00010380 [Phytophthora megakarya]